MAVFEWPTNPVLDQVVIGPNGQPYRWDGVKWVAVQQDRWAPIINPAAGQNNYSPFDIDGGDY